MSYYRSRLYRLLVQGYYLRQRPEGPLPGDVHFDADTFDAPFGYVTQDLDTARMWADFAVRGPMSAPVARVVTYYRRHGQVHEKVHYEARRTE